jgi:hypothetical protein
MHLSAAKKKIQKQAEKSLRETRKEEAVIRIQSLQRGRAARKQYKNLCEFELIVLSNVQQWTAMVPTGQPETKCFERFSNQRKPMFKICKSL